MFCSVNFSPAEMSPTANSEQRTAEDFAGLFLLGEVIADGPERLLGGSNRIDHRFEFVGLQRERTVGPGIIAGKGKVFFDDAGTKCDGGNRDGDAKGVVGEPDWDVKRGGHVRDRAEVHLFGWRGVGAGAFQECQWDSSRLRTYPKTF